ncbi:MAG TPA: fumarylacetoacetate hydrolase family protein [Polyangia bacterium]|nr:fumarylacetoacetate hydrolase family protein [Polyangia bacterium]
MASRLAVHDPRRPIGPDDLFPDDPAHPIPRIVRFLGTDGSPRIGVVRVSVQGLPRHVIDLTGRHGLGPGLLDFIGAGGLELAERALEHDAAGGAARDDVTLAPEDLPARLLSPIDIDAAQIERGERLIVGFGLTFRSHSAEAGGARPFVFPKPTVPSGAYAPVAAGLDGDRPAALLDYELELGCVALRDVDLDRLDHVDAAADFGYLVVNDVTTREPILRRRRTGYTQAKARPTYLPCGPWLVAGKHFTRDAPALRRMVLTVTETTPHADHQPHTLRQNARLEDLTLGLQELLAILSAKRSLTMPGVDGRRWPISVTRGGRPILPAGSLLLTGTPGGTAIRAPGRADRIRLALRSVRYLRWPSEDYRRHLADRRHAFGFLSPGDRVSGWITGLGRQEWEVRPGGADAVA